MSDEYLVAGSHPDTLANGRPIAPGDTVPRDQVNPDDPHDADLLSAGALIDVAANRADAKGPDAGPSKPADKPKEN